MYMISCSHEVVKSLGFNTNLISNEINTLGKVKYQICRIQGKSG